MNLTISDLRKKYGTKVVVDSLNLELREGVIGLLGPNGAGKTTLMRMVCNLLKPTAGTVCYDGEEIRRMGERYRDKLGYVPQEIGYYPWFTGQKYLEYLSCLKGMEKQAAKERIDQVLEQVALTGERKKRIGAYSGGMVQRLGIAQALLNDPEILILDEPTAGLDPRERIRFKNLITRIAGSRLILLSTHIVADIEDVAGYIVMLKSGKVELQGTREELLERMEGRVFSLRIDVSELEKYAKEYLVCGTHPGEGYVDIRFVSEGAVPEEAVPVPARLEDLYLYQFMGVEGDL